MWCVLLPSIIFFLLFVSSSSQDSDWWLSDKWWLADRQARTVLRCGYSTHLQTTQRDTQQSGRIHHCSWPNKSGAASLCEKPLLLYDITKLPWLKIHIESGLVWLLLIWILISNLISLFFNPYFELSNANCCVLGLNEMCDSVIYCLES